MQFENISDQKEYIKMMASIGLSEDSMKEASELYLKLLYGEKESSSMIRSQYPSIEEAEVAVEDFKKSKLTIFPSVTIEEEQLKKFFNLGQ
jgi:hypothetical protein